jgi:DNA-binding response OmpR family regulator
VGTIISLSQFDIRELNARTKAILKRGSAPFMDKLSVRNLTLDPEKQVITSNDALSQ